METMLHRMSSMSVTLSSKSSKAFQLVQYYPARHSPHQKSIHSSKNMIRTLFYDEVGVRRATFGWYACHSLTKFPTNRITSVLSIPSTHQQQQHPHRHQQHRGLFHMLPIIEKSNDTKNPLSNHVSPTVLLDEHKRRSMAHRVWDREAVADLFAQYAQTYDGTKCLNCDDIRSLLRGIGEVPADATVSKLFAVADGDGNGLIDMEEFFEHADMFLGDNPARIILIVGGPGSGKGLLSKRLTAECNVIHLSSGDLLRQEVASQTNLGRTVRDIMSRGELVSSAIMVALMKKRMKDHPGKRVLLDGFPRSIENAHDLMTLCGKPELALHLNCDDTILMERIMGRGASSGSTPQHVRREDDNFQAALQRLRTFHKYHHSTMEWLSEQHVPIINLDCTGTAESVWQQLLAIGRLMRPAVKLPIPATKDSSIQRPNGDDSLKTT
jgi:adenylate kinase